MRIPKEILEKYHIDSDSEEVYIYTTFLIATDYEIIKGFESLLSEPSKFLTNLLAVAKNLKEIAEYRAIAREEINKAD